MHRAILLVMSTKKNRHICMFDERILYFEASENLYKKKNIQFKLRSCAINVNGGGADFEYIACNSDGDCEKECAHTNNVYKYIQMKSFSRVSSSLLSTIKDKKELHTQIHNHNQSLNLDINQTTELHILYQARTFHSIHSIFIHLPVSFSLSLSFVFACLNEKKIIGFYSILRDYYRQSH